MKKDVLLAQNIVVVSLHLLHLAHFSLPETFSKYIVFWGEYSCGCFESLSFIQYLWCGLIISVTLPMLEKLQNIIKHQIHTVSSNL